jgi:hypothetical protein
VSLASTTERNAEAGKGRSLGSCQRTGPIVIRCLRGPAVEGVWPHVRGDDWCGEWAAGNRRPDLAATTAMSSLMQSGAAAARSVSPTPMFVATEPSSEPVHPLISTLLHSQTGSD